jgi:hypothetical protein
MTQISLSGGAKLEAKLDEIARNAGRPAKARIGFLEGATYPDGTSVAMVAALLNFGTSAGKAWPFFTNMIAEKGPGWGDKMAALLKAADYDAPKTMALMGQGIANQLRQSIRDTDSPPLAPATIKRKGSSKPLVDTGYMLSRVDYEVSDGDD